MFVTNHGPSVSDVEIYYLLPTSTESLSEETLGTFERDLHLFKLINYTNASEKEVKVPVSNRRVRLALRFFQESPLNTVSLRFTYSFT